MNADPILRECAAAAVHEQLVRGELPPPQDRMPLAVALATAATGSPRDGEDLVDRLLFEESRALWWRTAQRLHELERAVTRQEFNHGVMLGQLARRIDERA